MSKNITLMGAQYSAVPAVSLPQTGGGTATFYDVSDTTATAGTVLSGSAFYDSTGAKTNGSVTFSTYYTGSGTPSSGLGSNGDIYLQTGS